MSVIAAYFIVGLMAGCMECFRSRDMLRLSLLQFLSEVSKQLAAKRIDLTPMQWSKLVWGWRWGSYSLIFAIGVFGWPYLIYRDVRKAFKKEDGTPHE